MDWLDILGRIEGGEDDQTEFKRIFDKSSVGKAVCAFANTEGGVIILGVTDGQEIVGVDQDAEEIQEKLTSFLQTCCSAPVNARLGRHKDPKGWVHWVDVHRQRGLEPMQYDGQVWVRRGRSSVRPSPAELQELYNAFGYILTEERTIQAATASDVDMGAFRTYLQKQGLDILTEPQPDHNDDLRNRGVVADSAGELHPTLYGVLAFGKQPQKYPHMSNFMIECAVYMGTDRSSDVLVTSKVAGRIDEQVLRSVDWLNSLGRFESYRGLLREDRPLLPPRAIRESLVNAVAHRDYAVTGSKILLEVFEGHVDVTSPGGLPNSINAQSVLAGGHPRTRNESIANYMVVMDLMEQRGRGWPTMRHEMLGFNGTEPELIEDGTFVRVRFSLQSPA